LCPICNSTTEGHHCCSDKCFEEALKRLAEKRRARNIIRAMKELQKGDDFNFIVEKHKEVKSNDRN
jgi:fructose 1,6-bisphosphatase